MQLSLVLSLLTAVSSSPLVKRATTSVTLTTRDHECIASGNTRCAPTAGGQIDPGAVGGRTQCGGPAVADNIVGLDPSLFFVGGSDLGEGISDGRTRCGKTVTISLNGKSRTAIVADRVTPGTGVGGPQVDVSPDIAAFFGLSAATNTLTQRNVQLSYD